MHEGDTDVLVLVTDISWVASFNSCEQFGEKGDTLTVVIKHVDASSGKIAASIRDRFANPWVHGELQPGSRYTAGIVRFVQHADRCDDGPAYLVEILPGAYAMLCARGIQLYSGNGCDIIVTDSNPKCHAVSLALADTPEQ